MVKLSPNVTDISEMALAAESEGADAVSMINTLTGMRIDIRTRRPIIHNNTGGFSGPALLPIAVRMVWQTYQKVKIPIVGLGGISTWQDAVEMLLAGATAPADRHRAVHGPVRAGEDRGGPLEVYGRKRRAVRFRADRRRAGVVIEARRRGRMRANGVHRCARCRRELEAL